MLSVKPELAGVSLILSHVMDQKNKAYPVPDPELGFAAILISIPVHRLSIVLGLRVEQGRKSN